MANLAVTLATRNYDSVQPIAMGDVHVDGLDLTVQRSFDALTRLSDPSLQGGETSFSRYLQALARGDNSLVGLPVWPMRGFRQRTFFVRDDSSMTDVAELAGRRVGINEWPATGNTWARAVLRERGVDIWSIQWLVGQVSVGYKPVPPDKLPKGVERAPDDRLLIDMLVGGEIDAVCCPWPPAGFYDPGARFRRLYVDFKSAERDYYRRTGVYPGHHIVVLKRGFVDRHPEAVGKVYRAFDESRRQSLATHRALAETLPWLLAELEEDATLMGPEIQPYGVAENHHMVAAFCDELYAQGLAAEPIDPSLPFAEFERQMASV